MSRGFRFSTLLGEAFANLRSSWVLSLCVASTAALGGIAVVETTTSEVTQVIDTHLAAVGRGSTVFSVSSTDGTPISAARCDALNSVTGIRAAGAVLSSQTEAFPLGATRRAYVTLGTPGLIAVIWPFDANVSRPATPVVGATLAKEYGLVEGASLPLGGTIYSDVVVATSTSPRDDNYDNRVVVPTTVTPETVARSCLVDAAPGSRSTVERLLTEWFPAVPPVFAVPVVDVGAYPDAGQMMVSRATQLSGLVGALIITVVYGLVCTMRRADYALYRILGMSSWSRLIMLSTETVSLVLVPLAAGAALGLILSSPADQVVIHAVALELSKAGSAAVLLPVLGFVITTSGGPIRALKQG